MFETFSDSARQAIVDAQGHARALRHPHIGTEHLLLGCVSADAGVSELLGSLGAPFDRLRVAVGKLSPSEGSGGGALPFTAGAKRALEQALRIALKHGHPSITPEHLLLALLREPDATVPRVLAAVDLRQAIIVSMLERRLDARGLDEGLLGPLAPKVGEWARHQARAHERPPDGGDLLEAVIELDPLAGMAMKRLGIKPGVVRRTLEELRDEGGPYSRAPWHHKD